MQKEWPKSYLMYENINSFYFTVMTLPTFLESSMDIIRLKRHITRLPCGNGCIMQRDGRCQETSGPYDTPMTSNARYTSWALTLSGSTSIGVRLKTRARAFVISAVVVPVLSDSRRWQLFSFRGWQTEFITEKTGSFFFTLKALFEKEKALAVEALENYPQ